MKKLQIIAVALLITNFVFAQGKVDTWNEFAKTKFESKYYEKLGEYLFYPKNFATISFWMNIPY